MARPLKVTKERIDRICETIETETVSLDTAARAGGISPATFYRYQQDARFYAESPDEARRQFVIRMQLPPEEIDEYCELLEYFIDKVSEALAKAEIMLVKEVRQQKGGAKFLLKARYGYTEETIVTRRTQVMNDNKSIDFKQLSTTDLEQLIEGTVIDDDTH